MERTLRWKPLKRKSCATSWYGGIFPANEARRASRSRWPARLLLNTSEEVVQISEAVGYSSPRTFNRAFFKQTGVSPTEYRKTRSAKTQIRHFVSTATTSRIIESADKVIKQ